MRTTTRFLTIIPLALGLAAAASCSEESDNGIDEGESGGTGGTVTLASGGTGAGQGGADGGGSGNQDQLQLCDTSDFEELGNCGWTTNSARIKTPNLLFVIDKSGSMADPIDSSDDESPDKWSGLIEALQDALGDVDPDVGFGLILFPHNLSNPLPLKCNETAPCCAVPEGESAVVVEMTRGDDGVADILDELESVGPGGGTPTAEALERAKDYFLDGAGNDLSGEKYVVLATDGGPNCNRLNSCDADTCTTNIEDNCATGNCCADAPESCVDDDGVSEQIQALAAHNIKTFVVGIPGSKAYAEFLSQFAQDGDPDNDDADYYAVEAADGVDGLTGAFRDISTQLVQSCEIPLEENPSDPDKINVAIDCELIPQTEEDEDGNEIENWTIDYETTPGTLYLQGETCDRVQTEGAKQVDVVLGCPGIS